MTSEDEESPDFGKRWQDAVANLKELRRSAYNRQEGLGQNNTLSILPSGILAWDQLERNPQAAYPWPFNCKKIEDIKSSLAANDPHPSYRVYQVVFVCWRFLQMRSASKGRSSPKKEIEAARSAATNLVEKLTKLSNEAKRTADFGLELNNFVSETRHLETRLKLAMASLKNDKGGRGEKADDKWLAKQLQKIYVLSYSNVKAPNKWEQFILACTMPLAGLRLSNGQCALEAKAAASWRHPLKSGKAAMPAQRSGRCK